MSIGIIIIYGVFAAGILIRLDDLWGSEKVQKQFTFMQVRAQNISMLEFNAAVAAFDAEDEILVLFDLWSGSPFNQASRYGRKSRSEFAIITG